MIAQTVQFTGISPEILYNAYLTSREHSAMTAGSRPAFFFRPSVGEVAHGQEGDELRAFGFTDPDRQPQFSLYARILQLVPGQLIVLTWKNMGWNYSLGPSAITQVDSTVVLQFKK